jgi:hypothetical protein
MATRASIESRLKKLEARVTPPGRLIGLYVYYGCDTPASIAARTPALADGDMLVGVVRYTCQPDTPRHSHAQEKPWNANHPPHQKGTPER